MGYTVLARRYRSQTFDDVVGQDAVAQTLKNAIKSARVAHAYLFSGTRGVGKTTMARILAKSLNCLEAEGPTSEPCCKCDSCIAINLGEDIDVIEIDGASNTGVDNIRQLRQNAIYRPARARYKIYIIDEVHMLSTGAFNALLKILEEPPEHVKFIFATTEPNKVLPTIQSRCQRFDFSSITPAAIAGQLKAVLKSEKIKFEDDLVLHVARLANGSMRDALSLLDQLISVGVEPLTIELLEEFLGEPNRVKICGLIGDIGDANAPSVLTIIDDLLKTGQSCVQLSDSVIDHMRDLMVIITAGVDSELLVLTADERKLMTTLAAKFDIPALIYSITALEKLRWTIKNSDNPRALLEASMLRLTLSEHFIGVDRLLAHAKNAPAPASTSKKKPLTVTDPQPSNSAPPVFRQTAKPVPTVAPPTQLDLDTIKANWQNILDSATGTNVPIAVALSKTTLAAFNNNTLTIGFTKSDNFNQSRCEKKPQMVKAFLVAAMGADINLRFETISDTSGDSLFTPPGAKASKKQNEEVMNEPSVKKVMSQLNASLVKIEHNTDFTQDPDEELLQPEDTEN
ncbi:MAG: DNA polymerase III subunit gamma/tau [Anaerohalosphaera sp.]|nr:DNA polymerase III subunit gamma/tau [Anaerohalosphaera sp.]